MVKNGRGIFDLGALKSALSQEWIDEMGWFFARWYKFRKVNSYFDNFWVGIVKTERDHIYHRALKSGFSHKWADWLNGSCMLKVIEKFLIWWPINSAPLTFKCWGTLQLYLARIFRKNSLYAKVSSSILKTFAIDFCWKCTWIKIDIV